MMKKIFGLSAIFLLTSLCGVNATVRITEIMTSNVATVISEKYNYDGYVEFYNDGAEVDLKGWTVTNIKKGEVDWSARLDSTHVLPYGYSLLFFGKTETSSVSASKFQQNYVGRVGHKLSTDEGSLSFEKDGKSIEIFYPAQYPHLSYCDGFMMPTPGKKNDQLVTDIANRVLAPSFKSSQPGFYDKALSVELAYETVGSTIYYTMNGEAPTPETGKVYSGSIWVDKTTVIRARAYKEGMLYSEILTGSFIFPDKFYTDNECVGTGERLPIVSLVVDPDDMFGDMLGIYVEGTNGAIGGCYPTPYNFYQDWMRSANFEYILDGQVVDNQEVEIGVYGGCTRIHTAKSLKIKANKRSGKNKMTYTEFFPERSYTKIKSLALRNGGNGYSYVPPKWRDMFIQSLGDGMNLDKQASQPVSFYINGTFYGMMILTERTDEDYLYHNYGLEEDEIDLIGSGYVLEHGTMDAYLNMVEYVRKNYNRDDFYDKLNEMMDIDEYIDYQILEQYVGNTDWVINNIKFWRKRDGGRFRWIVYDTDFGLSKATSVDKDMIKFATSEKGTETCWVLLRTCLQNEDFRWKFLDQYLDRIENQFSDERINTKLDSIWDLTRLDMCATLKNSGLVGGLGSVPELNGLIEEMRAFALKRKYYVVEQLKQQFGLGDDTVVLKVRTVTTDGTSVEVPFLINKREHINSKYNSWVYSNERVKVEAVVPYGYRINHWLLNNEPYRNDDGSEYKGSSLTAIATGKELKISIFFEKDPDSVLPTHLCLNEVCASNESTLDENGDAPDWIEVYNGGDADVDMAGMVIENETKGVRYTIPSGTGETLVPAHGYKLLWADKNPELGPLHLNFKLGASASEKVVLLTSYQGKELELSSLVYTPHNTDESYGRVTDGDESMTLFSKCEDNEGNEMMTSTPLTANGSVDCPNSVSVEQVIADNRQVFVQGKSIHVQNAQGGEVHIYSALGDMVDNVASDTDELVINVSIPGVYLVKVDKKCWKVVVE